MSTRPIHRLTPLLLNVVLGFSSISQAQSRILFSCRIPTNLPQWQMLVDVFSEAFGALGYDFEMHYLNGRRENYELKNSDKYDGTCIRLKSFSAVADEYNMVVVNSPVGDPYTSVWKNRKIGEPEDPSSLFIKDANVGYLRGNGVAESYLKDYGPINTISFLRPDLGIKTLVSGRIDYWVGYSHTAEHLAEHMNFYGSIEKIADVRQDYFYPVISKRYLDIKPQLEHELTRIMGARAGLIR